MKGRQPRRDALHRANYTDGRTEVFHLDGFEDETDGWSREGDMGLQVAWSSAITHDPTENILSALDRDAWLAAVPQGDRDLLARRIAGLSLEELALRTDRSISWVFARLRRLGRDLAFRCEASSAKSTRTSQMALPIA